jgi:SAM-dependent methyltransferase
VVDRQWFEQWFDQDYLLVYTHRDSEDAARGVQLLLEAARPAAGARILDLGCGTGRHALPLCRQDYRVVGVDLSAVLLAAARERLAEAGCWLPLVRADLRRLPFRAVFDLAASFFTSFGYFESTDDDRLALDSMVGCLRPGGTLLLDLINPVRLRAELVPASHSSRDGVDIVETRRLEEDRIIKTITLHRDGRTRTVEERVRLYDREKLERLCPEHGLDKPRYFGDYDGSAAQDHSPRLILVARRVG